MRTTAYTNRRERELYWLENETISIFCIWCAPRVQTNVSEQPASCWRNCWERSTELCLSSLCPQLKADGKKGNEKEKKWIAYSLSIAHLQDFLSSGLHTTNTGSFFMKKKSFGTSSIDKSYCQYWYIRGKTHCIRLTNRESGKRKVEDELSLFFLLYLPGPTLKRVLSVTDLPRPHPWYFLSRPTWCNPRM